MENLLCLPTVHRTKPALCFLQRVDRCRGHLRTKFHLSPSHAVCYPCCWVCFRCGRRRRRRQARPALTHPEHREYSRKHVHVCLGYMIVMAGTCVLWASCAWRIKFLIEIHCLWHTADLWFLMSLTTAWQCSHVTHRSMPDHHQFTTSCISSVCFVADCPPGMCDYRRVILCIEPLHVYSVSLLSECWCKPTAVSRHQYTALHTIIMYNVRVHLCTNRKSSTDVNNLSKL